MNRISPIRAHRQKEWEKTAGPKSPPSRARVVSDQIEKCLRVHQAQSIHAIFIKLRRRYESESHFHAGSERKLDVEAFPALCDSLICAATFTFFCLASCFRTS